VAEAVAVRSQVFSGWAWVGDDGLDGAGRQDLAGTSIFRTIVPVRELR
jgi:hypothetical protein